ncbi:hypothetical protein N8971_00330 [Flavobacteriaceae bacterium]|nr:hypothetical protein [Flavobacteriaceae bacterium]
MKKGLLSILASALLVVGCQNYDDQFTLLENQITALTQTVDGLSQVQSTLASLSGTVNSLSSTVSGLGDAIDTAVSEGLADIQEDITAIETAVADVASSDAVSDLADAVAASQEDLDDLLANSSVFTGNVIINNASTLDAFYNMGSTLAIVNGYVDIDVTSSMDIEKVQAVVDEILTTTGEFDYSAATDVTGVTFNNLSGTQTLTLEQADGYEVKSLVSAGNITLKDTYESKVDIIDLRALTTLASLSDGTDHQLDFSSATEIHLTSVAYYPGGNLTINTKKDGVVDLTALTDTNASDVVAPFTLTIDGPASLTLSNIKGDAAGTTKGAITLTDVETVNISNFGGTITLGDGVENATLEDVATSPVITAATDLISLSLEGVTDYGKTFDTSGTTAQTAALNTANFIDLAISSAHNDLESLTVTGKVQLLDVDSAPSLNTIVINGHVDDLNIEGLGDLTSVTTTGSKFNNVLVYNNDDLLELTLDYDLYTTVATTADAKGELNVNGNAKLASLTVNTTALNDLDIHTNAKLATVSFPNLAAAGIGTTPDVDIYGNAFVATSATDNYDATAAGAAIVTGTTDGTTNTGSYASTSGVSSLKTWIDAAIAVGPTTTNSPMQVWFDTIDETKTADVNGTITTGNPGAASAQDTTTEATLYAVVYIEAAVTSGRSVSQAKTIVVPVAKDVNGVDKVLSSTGSTDTFTITNGLGGTKTFGYVASTITTVDQLVAAMNGSTVVPGITIESDRDAFHEQIVTISWTYSDGTAAQASSTLAANKDKLYFTYGTDPETGAAIATQATVTANSASGAIAVDIATALNAATHAYVATGSSDGKIRIAALVSGTLNEDYSPIPHSFNTMSVVTNVDSTTLQLAGANSEHIVAASSSSNTTAIASSLFNFSTSAVTTSGVRVTIKSASTTINSSMTVTSSVLSSAFAGVYGGDAGEFVNANGLPLTAGSNIVGTGLSSSVLDYVAAFSDIESTSTTTPQVTDRTSWL